MNTPVLSSRRGRRSPGAAGHAGGTGPRPGRRATGNPASPWERFGLPAAGAVAAGIGLGLGELASGLFPSAVPSPVVAVGDAVVDLSPGSAVRTGIETVGRADKPLLLIAIVVASLLIGAAITAVPTRSSRAILGGFTAMGVVALWAASREDQRNLLAVVIVQALAVAAATAVARALRQLALAAAVPAPSGAPPSRGMPPAAPAAPAAPTSPLDPPASRRAFLAYAGAGAAFATVTAVGGQKLRGRSSAERARAAVSLPPSVAPPAGPGPGGTFDQVAGVSPFITPNADFYRIDTALLVPQVTPDRWQLRITGLVDRELGFRLDDLLAMPLEEHQVTLACVSNDVGGDLVGNASWRGIPLLGVLQQAGIRPEATQVVGESVDGFTAGFPLSVLDGRPALIAVGMNGEPLPVVHGFPARLVVPGLYGYVSATKWLSEIRLTRWEDEDGYWIPRGWSKEGPVKTQSRIDVPRRGAKLGAGTVAVAGVAWAPTRGIGRVEVQVDEGPWQEAELAPVAEDVTWVQWLYRWPAVVGDHQLAVRAVDGTGAVQPEERHEPAPDGATGHHTIRVEVV